MGSWRKFPQPNGATHSHQAALLSPCRSWREFPHPDEEDVEGAESREHRRWIDRNNSKLREKAKKEDGKRMKEFVENAYRIDPRIAKKKEDEKNEKWVLARRGACWELCGAYRVML